MIKSEKKEQVENRNGKEREIKGERARGKSISAQTLYFGAKNWKMMAPISFRKYRSSCISIPSPLPLVHSARDRQKYWIGRKHEHLLTSLLFLMPWHRHLLK